MRRTGKHLDPEESGSLQSDADGAPLSVALHLDDLIPDKTGAIVIQSDGERLEIQLEDWDEVLARGIASEETRSEHFDVSGMDFVTFSNGVTLYFPAGQIALTLKPAPRPASSTPKLSLFKLIDRELGRGTVPVRGKNSH